MFYRLIYQKKCLKAVVGLRMTLHWQRKPWLNTSFQSWTVFFFFFFLCRQRWSQRDSFVRVSHISSWTRDNQTRKSKTRFLCLNLFPELWQMNEWKKQSIHDNPCYGKYINRNSAANENVWIACLFGSCHLCKAILCSTDWQKICFALYPVKAEITGNSEAF